MRIQCNGCETAEAKVLCCADEAALCWACDEKIHTANKLARKHQRVTLSGPSSPLPKCDICQESVGLFFCLEDRALLCRKCDVGIHTANPYVSGHQRYLVTGVKVGLEATEPFISSAEEGSNLVGKSSRIASASSISTPQSGIINTPLAKADRVLGGQNFQARKPTMVGSNTSGSTINWPRGDYLGFKGSDPSHGVGVLGNTISKVSGRYCL